MNYDKRIEALKEAKARSDTAQSWRTRIDNLKQKGIVIKAFCERHGLDHMVMNHQTMGRRGITQKQLDKLNKALNDEGV